VIPLDVDEEPLLFSNKAAKQFPAHSNFIKKRETQDSTDPAALSFSDSNQFRDRE
jgi:hypothetical protein